MGVGIFTKKIEFESGTSQSGTIVHYVYTRDLQRKKLPGSFLEANENIANASITF